MLGQVFLPMEIALRILVALTAGGLIRMLQVFGILPLSVALAILAAVGGLLSYRLTASRLFVVMSPAVSYFVAFLYTQAPPDPAMAVDTNPPIFALLMSGLETFFPFAMPALGSWVAYRMEKRMEKKADLDKEITVDDLLQEPIPAAPASELTYDEVSDLK